MKSNNFIQCSFCKANSLKYPLVKFENIDPKNEGVSDGCSNCRNYYEKKDVKEKNTVTFEELQKAQK